MLLIRGACCGFREIHNLHSHHSPENAIKVISNYFRERDPDDWYNLDIDKRWATCVFTQAGKRAKYGVKFAAYIREHNLGDLVELDFKRNPNSGRFIKTWLWAPDQKAIKAHVKTLE